MILEKKAVSSRQRFNLILRSYCISSLNGSMHTTICTFYIIWESFSMGRKSEMASFSKMGRQILSDFPDGSVDLSHFLRPNPKSLTGG
jgi:hypothetical protein